jgi:hypothetical protein
LVVVEAEADVAGAAIVSKCTKWSMRSSMVGASLSMTKAGKPFNPGGALLGDRTDEIVREVSLAVVRALTWNDPSAFRVPVAVTKLEEQPRSPSTTAS